MDYPRALDSSAEDRGLGYEIGFTFNLVPRAMPVRGLGLALALEKRNEIRNFIGCREINNLGAA